MDLFCIFENLSQAGYIINGIIIIHRQKSHNLHDLAKKISFSFLHFLQRFICLVMPGKNVKFCQLQSEMNHTTKITFLISAPYDNFALSIVIPLAGNATREEKGREAIDHIHCHTADQRRLKELLPAYVICAHARYQHVSNSKLWSKGTSVSFGGLTWFPLQTCRPKMQFLSWMPFASGRQQLR